EHGLEDGHGRQYLVGMLGPRLAGRDSADDLRAVFHRLPGVERALAAGNALADDLCVLVDENGHAQAAFFTASVIFLAASPRSSAGMIAKPLSAMIFLPCSTLVPSKRTTSGTLMP